MTEVVVFRQPAQVPTGYMVTYGGETENGA